MLFFTLSLMFAIAAIILIVKRKIVTRQATPAHSTYYRAIPEKEIDLKPIGFGLLSASLLCLLVSMVYKLDVGEAAVLKPISGNVTEADTTAGFSLKAPWESVVKYEIRNQAISFFGTEPGVEFTDDGIKDMRITGNTRDNADAYIDMTIQYSINPEMVLDIYRDYRTADSLKSRKIHPGIRGAVQEPPTKYATAEIRQRRPELGADMKKVIEDKLRNEGVTVESIDLRAINFTTPVQNSLNAVQERRAQTEAARESLNTATLDAEKVRVDAQAQSDADQITRCGATSKETTVTVNGIQSKQTKVTPVPAARCQNRLNEQVLTSKYIDMLKEAAAKGNTVYVIPQGSNNLIQLNPSAAGGGVAK